MSRLSTLVAVAATTALLLAPAAAAATRTVTREYYTSNGAVIIYMSNYYIGDWDMGGNRFTMQPGETAATILVDGGATSSIVQVLDSVSNVLTATLTCDGTASVSLPANAKFVRVFVGSDATMGALYGAPACGVDTPPAHGFITTTFS